MPRLFLSYRRSDTQMVAGRLRESLVRHLGEDAVFRDKDSIAAGEDWTQAIRQSLTGEVAVLALVGHDWANAKDEQGRRRLDDPADWNRIELEQALAHGGRVIPILVDGAQMPRESDLPESLRPLVRRNALKLRDDDWEPDVQRLMRALGMQGPSAPGLGRRAAAAAAAPVLIAAVAAYWWWYRAPDEMAARPSVDTRGASYRADIVARLNSQQHEALQLLGNDRPRAIRLIDDNLGAIDEALESFPDAPELHALAGYAAKNVYASSKGMLPAESRRKYLTRARQSFERALALAPDDAGAVNGMGNVLFYEQRFAEAIKHHKRAVQLAGGNYPEARGDLDLVERVRDGRAAFDP